MARRAGKGYLVRLSGNVPAMVAFLPHPELPGMWLRCHPSELLVRCPTCRSQRGEPCRGTEGYWTSGEGHVNRREAFQHSTTKITAAAGMVFDLQLRLATERLRPRPRPVKSGNH